MPGQLQITVTSYERAKIYQPGDEIISVNMRLENLASEGGGQMAPEMELSDGKGRRYELIKDYRLMSPVPPAQLARATQHFIVQRGASNFKLVIAPGSDQEAVVHLDQGGRVKQ